MMKKKILMMDPARLIQDSACSKLAQTYEVIRASGGEEAVRLYEQERPDLILTDLNLPRMSGLDLQRVLQEKYKEVIPMMFLSADEDEESELRVLEGGAFDYVRQPFREEILLRRVENIMRHVERIQNLQIAAETDLMTGLSNKSYARRALTDLCFRATGMLMMVDLDSFKLVNDLYGHAMGDKVLIRFAEILRSVIRSADIAGRMGGDEFCIFCQDVREEITVARKTEQMNELLLASAKEYMGDDMQIPLGASVGAVAVPDEGRNFDDLYRKADQALYQVKRTGKHGYYLFRRAPSSASGDANGNPDTLNQLSLILEERNRKPGAYALGFDQFQTVFRYLTRAIENYHRPVELALFTLTPAPGSPYRDCISPDEADAFAETLGKSLRRSDVYTQPSHGQYLVIFSESDGANENAIMDRIFTKWRDCDASNAVQVNYETRVVYS